MTSRRMILGGLCSGALIGVGCASSDKENLTVAAAASLKFALDDAARDFGRSAPDTNLRITYGSSGHFYSQIRLGGPWDVFLSADMDYPSKLAADRIGVPDSLFEYGAGSLVVWTTSDSKLDPSDALRDPTLKRLAIANPEHAPYGRAAVAALESLGLYDALSRKLVLGESVEQAFAFVRSGAADAGIIALSLALSPEAGRAGRFSKLPTNLYPRMRQAGLILKDSPAARTFCAYLKSPEGMKLLARYGLSTPETR